MCVCAPFGDLSGLLEQSAKKTSEALSAAQSAVTEQHRLSEESMAGALEAVEQLQQMHVEVLMQVKQETSQSADKMQVGCLHLQQKSVKRKRERESECVRERDTLGQCARWRIGCDIFGQPSSRFQSAADCRCHRATVRAEEIHSCKASG